MKQGVLIYDEETGRYDIRFSLEEYYGGLHCGETFDVYVNGKWKPARIEMGNDWYLVGIQTKSDRFSVVLVFPATRSFKYWEKCKQVADST